MMFLQCGFSARKELDVFEIKEGYCLPHSY